MCIRDRFKAQEIGSVGNAIFSTTSGANSAMGMGAGFYYASGNYKYANTGGVPVGMIFNYSANGQIAWVNAASGTVNNNITFNQAMTLDNSGNLAIGTTSAVNSRLYVSNTGVAQLIIGYNNTANNYFDADTQIFRNSSAAERARIDSSGNLLVGDTANATGSTSRLYALSNGSVVASTFKSVNSTYECSVLWNNATSGNNLFATFATETSITSRGSITYNRAGGLVVYNTTSDYRAKDISGPVTNSGSLIDSVPVYMGKMKWATEERPMFIAHETPTYAHTGEKDAVDKDGNPVYQQMDASALIPVMWAEIQSLRKRILTLENK